MTLLWKTMCQTVALLGAANICAHFFNLRQPQKCRHETRREKEERYSRAGAMPVPARPGVRWPPRPKPWHPLEARA